MAARKLIVFIDTNIFLDFYKPGFESGLSILKHVDGGRDRIIVTPQVEMEFKKNRQKVILESLQRVKADWSGLGTLPTVLVESKQAKAIAKSRTQLDRLAAAFKKRLDKVLRSPTADPVYRSAQRLFRSTSGLNLASTNRADTIRRLALRRFLEGRPPRKKDDTSIGDAINWEWIIHCAKETSSNVVIVSRDTDYGAHVGKERIVNDWLAQEFRQRVGRRAQLSLTDRLTDGLKAAGLAITKAEAKRESETLTLASLMAPLSSDAFSKLAAVYQPISPDVFKLAATYRPLDTSALAALVKASTQNFEQVKTLGSDLSRIAQLYGLGKVPGTPDEPDER